MSFGEYLNLLCEISEEIDWETKRGRLMFIINRYLPDDSGDDITDVNSLLAKLEERSLLGIDRLDVLKDLLKGIRKWDLLRIVDGFEIKRKDYKQFLGKISRALDESNELQRLILLCRRQNLIAHERKEHIANVDALFTELEQQNNLGIGNLSILRTMATEVEKPNLCRLVDDFDEKRKQEEDAERERKEWEDYKLRARAQAASVLVGGINIGERLIGVVTPHCTFRNVTGGAVVVTTWMVLRRSPSMEAFVNAFKEAVLPFGNCLRAISEGSIQFTLQAENISALEALWQSYQDATLQTNLQEFLVTEEIKQLAGGEVTLTVHIDEDEYRNAMLDLMISETEEMKVEEKRGLKDRASSDSDLLKERNMSTANTKYPFPEREFLPFDRKVRVEEYLENLQETFSEITLPSDSGEGTWSSAPSEHGFHKGDRLEKLDRVEGFFNDAIVNWNSFQEAYKDAYPSEGDRLEKLNRVEGSLTDAIVNWNSFQEAYKDVYPSKGRALHSMEEEFKKIRITLGILREMEKEWIDAEPILTSSSSAQAVIQQLENFLQLDQGFFKNPTIVGKRAIRYLARKATNFKRFDVFDYLRKITPPGTTGPRLPDNLLIKEMPEDEKKSFSKCIKRILHRLLGLRSSDMNYSGSTSYIDVLARRHDLRTVGELYDFLSEKWLPFAADIL